MKTQKQKKNRKDFVKKRNIRQNNTPTPRYTEEVPILKAHREGGLIRREWGKSDRIKYGKIVYSKVGTKTVQRKGFKPILKEGDGILPKSKKINKKIYGK